MGYHNKKEKESDIEKNFIYLDNSTNDVSELLKNKFKEIITKSIKDIKSNMNFFSLIERIETLENQYSIVVKENKHSETELEESSFESKLDNLVKIITRGLSENWTEVIRTLLDAIKDIGYNGLKDLKTIKSWEFDIISSNDNTIIVTLVKLQCYNSKENRKILFFNKSEKNIKLSFISYKIEDNKKELEKYIKQEKENEIKALNMAIYPSYGTNTIIIR